MNKELALSFDSEVKTLQVIAKAAQDSGLYQGVGGEAKIFMILMAAKEMNIPPMQALNKGLNNIKGNIEISARLMGGMIRRKGHSIIPKECNSKICILEGTRADNGDKFSAQFTMEDAKQAGLAGKDNWRNYPEDMLYARAMSRLARRLFPDVIGTAYVEGEIADTIKEKKATKQENELEEADVQVVEETPEEKDALFSAFALDFHEEKPDLIKEYLHKYSNHWKKSGDETVADYEDGDKFRADFMKWKKKNYPED